MNRYFRAMAIIVYCQYFGWSHDRFFLEVKRKNIIIKWGAVPIAQFAHQPTRELCHRHPNVNHSPYQQVLSQLNMIFLLTLVLFLVVFLSLKRKEILS